MPNFPLVSIITPVLNGADTINDAIVSVLAQSYKNIEYIVVDNGSTDNTVNIIESYGKRISKIIHESKKGVYTAMNSGISSCSGDIVGILNSDDFYVDKEVIADVVKSLADTNAGICWGDLIYVKRNNTDKIIRYWKSSGLKESYLENGWMPPHPTFFVKRHVYNKYGLFREDLKISADYEFILRTLHKYKITGSYIPRILVRMRLGGESNKSIINIFKKISEDYKACKSNGIKNPIRAVFLKNISKIPQFFER